MNKSTYYKYKRLWDKPAILVGMGYRNVHDRLILCNVDDHDIIASLFPFHKKPSTLQFEIK